MASLQTSIRLQDQMTATLNQITQAMSTMITTCEAAQSAANQGINAAAWEAMRQQINQVSADVQRYREELERLSNVPPPAPLPVPPPTPAPAPTPPAPPSAPAATWSSAPNSSVFMNSGAERFAAEYAAADERAQQLHRTQQAISAQARSMTMAPPGMVNDITAMENRMQRIATRVQQLNSIPVNLRTEQTNRELERLRGHMDRMVVTQGQMNDAMGRMDISAANAAYQRLNSQMDTAERNIRDNFNEQERFNQSANRGADAMSQMANKLKGVVTGMAAAFGVKKVIQLADSVNQVTARLDLMNDGLQSTDELTQKIFASAQRARAPFMDTAAAISKMGLNAGNAFKSNGELIAFMEQVNKQFVIGGATAQEQSNAMIQLSQAMAVGALRGQDLNSILSAAPLIARSIEKNMGWAEGSIKKYAEKGAVTAEVVKNSLLNMAEETNERFNSMPMTFSQVLTTMQNALLQAFWPVIQMIGQGATYIYENWDKIGPVFYGAVAAILAAAAAWGIHAAATWLSVAANQALIMSLLSNPLTWVAIIIGVIVAQIYKWVQSVGGIRIAWLMVVNQVLTAADKLKIGLATAWANMQNGIDNMQYGFSAFGTGVLNAIGNLKVKGLTLIQDFINGAIDRINVLIEAVNSIAGTSFALIGHVEFAAGAAIEEEAKQAQRAADLAVQKDANAADKARRQAKIDEAQRQADRARMERQAGIAAAQNDAAKRAAESDNQYGGDSVAGNTGKTAANTAKMADTMDAMDEELKYMRDAAEQEVINRFTLAELKVDVNNNNTLTTQTDFADVNRMLGEATAEILAAAAEGGHL